MVIKFGRRLFEEGRHLLRRPRLRDEGPENSLAQRICKRFDLLQIRYYIGIGPFRYRHSTVLLSVG